MNTNLQNKALPLFDSSSPLHPSNHFPFFALIMFGIGLIGNPLKQLTHGFLTLITFKQFSAH